MEVSLEAKSSMERIAPNTGPIPFTINTTPSIQGRRHAYTAQAVSHTPQRMGLKDTQEST